ncbi:MAG TPA: hypothetical protein VNM92_13830 [Thermoanaerobaculia bacterium]|nr:hypothetical protein [Thermoanaerobaculia bacterium]
MKSAEDVAKRWNLEAADFNETARDAASVRKVARATADFADGRYPDSYALGELRKAVGAPGAKLLFPVESLKADMKAVGDAAAAQRVAKQIRSSYGTEVSFSEGAKKLRDELGE